MEVKNEHGENRETVLGTAQDVAHEWMRHTRMLTEKEMLTMADLIDRDALLKDMGLTDAVKYGNKCAEQQYRSYSTWMSYEIAVSIRDPPAVNRWISGEDALPENSHPVLITWVNNSPVMSCYEKDKGKHFTGCAHYCNGKWYWYSQFSDDILSEYGEYQETVDVDVIAWMPMPDAYEPKMEAENENR